MTKAVQALAAGRSKWIFTETGVRTPTSVMRTLCEHWTRRLVPGGDGSGVQLLARRSHTAQRLLRRSRTARSALPKKLARNS